jgi:hypothetical protein
MRQNAYRFNIGNFECIAVSDGSLTYAPPIFPSPATALFTNAPREQLEQILKEHDLQPDQWTEWTTCLVINIGESIVLVDISAGNLAPTTEKLVQNIKSVGIS